MIKFILLASLLAVVSSVPSSSKTKCNIVSFENYFPTTFYVGRDTLHYNYPQINSVEWTPVSIHSFYCTYNGTVICEPNPPLPPDYILTSTLIICMKVETGPLRYSLDSQLEAKDLVELGSCSLQYRLRRIEPVVHERSIKQMSPTLLEPFYKRGQIHLVPWVVSVILVGFTIFILVKIVLCPPVDSDVESVSSEDSGSEIEEISEADPVEMNEMDDENEEEDEEEDAQTPHHLRRVTQ